VAEEALGVLGAQRIAALLTGMTGDRFFGGSYPNSPVVERDFRTALQARSLPHICVLLESTEERQPMASVGGAQGYLTPYVYLLIGYVGRTTTIPPLDWAIRLSEDIERTLAAAFSLGGIAHRMTISPAEFDVEVNATDGVTKLAAFEMRVTANLQQTLVATP
jgi:hypothetical protein